MMRSEFARLVSAEWHRTLNASRIVAFIVFALVSVVSFIGTMEFLRWGVDSLGEARLAALLDRFIGFNVSALILSFMMGLYCSANVARDHEDGTVVSAAVAVPNRTRLFIARFLPWLFMAVASSLIMCVGVTLCSLGLIEDPSWTLLNASLNCVVVICVTTFAFSIATLMKRGGTSIFLYLLLWYLLPLMFGSVVGMGPPEAQELIATANMFMPGTAFPNITGFAPVGTSPDPVALARDCAITFAWVAGSFVAAWWFFKRRGTLPG